MFFRKTMVSRNNQTTYPIYTRYYPIMSSNFLKKKKKKRKKLRAKEKKRIRVREDPLSVLVKSEVHGEDLSLLDPDSPNCIRAQQPLPCRYIIAVVGRSVETTEFLYCSSRHRQNRGLSRWSVINGSFLCRKRL